VKKVARQREIDGEHWVFRYDNGLVIRTDPFMKDDPLRVLPAGGPQDAIIGYLASMPDVVVGKRVFDPFAGSGVLGLMALRLGAAHVDFLDVSPRAAEFQRDNARRNGFAAARFTTIVQSIAELEPASEYDLVLANPPFVPTPPGIAGTLTSNGGSEGSDLAELLLARLDRLLRPSGQALVYLMQLVVGDRPLIAAAIERSLTERSVELTAMQAELLPFEHYVAAYQQLFPDQRSAIERWAGALVDRHGPGLGLQHYVAHVRPRRPGPTTWSVHDDAFEKYGQVPYPSWSFRDLALARVMENVRKRG
jgi:SAM-dependent methyltransferase